MVSSNLAVCDERFTRTSTLMRFSASAKNSSETAIICPPSATLDISVYKGGQSGEFFLCEAPSPVHLSQDD